MKIPTQNRINPCPLPKFHLALAEEALAEAKSRVGSRELSAYVSGALIR